MGVKIFISHSSKDKKIIKLLIDVLEKAFVIPNDTIRCTSLPGYKLKSGGSTSLTLQTELNTCKVVIGVITPESLHSSWVLFEIGFAWGMKKWMVPLLVGINPETLTGPLKELNCISASKRSDIEQILEELSQYFKFEQKPRARITDTIDSFIELAKSYVSSPDVIVIEKITISPMSTQEQKVYVKIFNTVGDKLLHTEPFQSSKEHIIKCSLNLMPASKLIFQILADGGGVLSRTEIFFEQLVKKPEYIYRDTIIFRVSSRYLFELSL